MLKFIYNLATQLYLMGIRLAALRNEKARLWVQGRVGVFEKLEREIAAHRLENQRVVWMHCASLGEFEQGRTVIEALKKEQPSVFVLLTFFSPSGYEIRNNYPYADLVSYLPFDSKSNATRFIEIVRPSVAIFVKYEFWYHYLSALKENGVPSILISAKFRPSQPFFKWYGKLHRHMLACFDEIYVQDAGSLALLKTNRFQNVVLAGDNRIDRVLEIAKNPKDLPLIEAFCGSSPVLVCGSTWPADEAILNQVFSSQMFIDWKFILAPHDVQPARIQEIGSQLPIQHVRFSQMETLDFSGARLLLVDNIGMLSSLYKHGDVAYIGGGFGHSIHNTLEPAAHGLPVIFGPKYQKFEEAVWLVENGGGFVVRNGNELQAVLENLKNPGNRQLASTNAKRYITNGAGATQLVMRWLNKALKPLSARIK